MRLLLFLSLLLSLSSYDSTAQPSEFVHYSEVDVRPEPVGGFEALTAQTTYPELARRAGIEGTVIILFTVDKDGSVVYDPPEYQNGEETNRDRQYPICYEDPGGQTCETSIQTIRAALLHPASVNDKQVAVQECFAFEYWLPEGKGNSSVPTRIRVSPCP